MHVKGKMQTIRGSQEAQIIKSHQLPFQVKNEQPGGKQGKETSCFLLEIRELQHLLHQSCWEMQCLFEERKD